MRILLGDHHRLFVQNLQTLLEEKFKMEIVGTATNGYEVVRMAKILLPDVVIMDYSLPLQNGVDTAQKIRDLLPNTKIILLFMYPLESYVTQALQAGVSTCILKSNVYQELAEAFKALCG